MRMHRPRPLECPMRCPVGATRSSLARCSPRKMLARACQGRRGLRPGNWHFLGANRLTALTKARREERFAADIMGEVRRHFFDPAP
jgi:hypothetical protein